jgi:hypothetical protein
MDMKECANELGSFKDNRSSCSKQSLKTCFDNFIILLQFLAVPSKAASQSAFKMAKIHQNDTGKFNKNVPQ